MDKYKKLLQDTQLNMSDKEVSNKVAEIIKIKSKENNNIEVHKKIFNCIDITSLNTTDHYQHICDFTEKVNQLEEKFGEIENVAAICVYPNFVATVRGILQVSSVKIAAVAGSFPTSQTFQEIKTIETKLAIIDGADEIDIVINLGLFLSENYEEMCEEIYEIKAVCEEIKLKVIIESGQLNTTEKIWNASLLSIYSGADFIKTSTGKTPIAATLEAAYIMCNAIKHYYNKHNVKIGFKAAGGIVTTEEAVQYYTIVKEVLGEEWLNNDLFRIGASRLANNLLTSIMKENTVIF